MRNDWRAASRWLIPLSVAAAAVLPFLPSLHNGFVNLDDEWNLVFNWHYQGLGWPQLRWMFATSITHGNYEPLHWLLLAVTYEIFGPGPFGYHAVALLLHAAVAVLLYLAAREILGLSCAADRTQLEIDLCAAAGAVLFATHPLRAEPVAWISAQHYLSATMFALISVLAYLHWFRAEQDRGKWRWFSIAAFAASQLSLPVALTLPVSLLILDVYPLGRLGPSRELWPARVPALLREKIPYFLLILLGLATWFARAVVLRMHTYFHLLDTLILPWCSVYFCLAQTVAPMGLRPTYQSSGGIHASDPSIWIPALAMVAVTACLVIRRRAWPAMLAAWCSYLIALQPVSGYVASGLWPSLPADRYSYLPSLGLAILAGGGILTLAGKNRRAFEAALVCVLLVALGWSRLSWRQTRIWRSSDSLWSRAIAEGEDGPTVHIGKGYTLVEMGKIDEAIPHLQRAIEQEPTVMLPYYTLGYAFHLQGKAPEALRYFRLALERDHDSAAAWNASGIELAKMGRIDDAEKCFEQAILHDPQHPGAQMNLALCLADLGQTGPALDHYREALAINPNFLEARCNFAVDLLRMGRAPEAIRQFREVMRRDPAYLRSRPDLRGTLLKLGLNLSP